MSVIILSLIIPVFNEEKNVTPLYQEIKSVLKKIRLTPEIIFVDDGSTDNTFNKLKKLKGAKIIQLRKNCGQSAALDAGIKNSQGKILITLDGDGQNDPRDIPKLLNLLKKENDVVCGWRYDRKDSLIRKVISLGAKIFRKILLNDKIHDSGCTLRAYKKECFENLDLYGEMHRMIPALLNWRGYKITEVKVNHRPRKHGKSKYNEKRIIKGFLDMINIWFWQKYESRPMHIFGLFGLFLSFFGVALLLVLVLARLFYGYSLANKIWPLVGFFFFLIGGQFLVFGILANLIIQNKKEKNFYLIKQISKQ